MMADAYDCLDRFREPLNRDYSSASDEVRRGRKRSHWMWYVFPQLRGLGRSAMSDLYGIRDIEEACAFLADEELGSKLVEISEALLGLAGSDPYEVLGGIDARKLRSSITLFSRAAGDGSVFSAVLEKYFGGRECGRTVEMLGPQSSDGRSA